MRRTVSVRKHRRVVLGLAALGFTLAVVTLASWKPSGPAPTPLTSRSAEAPSPPASATLTPPPPTPIAVGPPSDFLPDCEGPRHPGPAAQAGPPLPGGIDFETVGRLGGPVSGAVVEGHHAFIGAGATIQVVDLESSSPTAVVATVALPAQATDLSLFGSRLSVAVGEAGLVVVDVADPGAPRLTAAVSLPGYAEGVDSTDRHAFVADGPAGLRIVDLADPAGPTVIGVVLDEHQLLDVAVSGPLAYAAAADEGLIVIDVGSQSAPRVMGSLVSGGYAYGVAVEGTTAYLADGWAGVSVIDVRDASRPSLLGTMGIGSWALDVETGERNIYVAAAAGGLVVIDPDEAVAEVVVGRLPLPGGRAVHVTIDDGIAYLTNALGGLVAVDVAQPSQPQALRSIPVLADVLDIAPVESGAYVAGGGGGLWAIESEAAGELLPVANVATTVLLQDVVALDSNVTASGSEGPAGVEAGVVAVDFTEPADPRPRDAYVFGAPDFSGWNPGARPAMQGSLAFYPMEVGLFIVDASARPPCVVGSLRTQPLGSELEVGVVGAVTVSGDTAYLGANADGIFVVDVSVPEAPVLVREVQVAAGVGSALLAVGAVLYAVDGGELVTYDLSDPRDPRRLGDLELPFETTALAYSDGRLFLAGQAAILAVDVSDPRAPRLVGRHDLPGLISRLRVRNGLLYAALGTDGLVIVRWSPGDGKAVVASPKDEEPFLGQAPSAALDGDRAAAMAAIGLRARPEPPTRVSECIVTGRSDDDPSSLRGCLDRSRGGTWIRFDPTVFPPSDPQTIEVQSELVVPPGVVIDGTGAGVILDGLGQASVGLAVSDRAVVIGLEVRNFTEVGISLNGDRSVVVGNVVAANTYIGIGVGGDENWISGNRIGTDRGGTRTAGLQFDGVQVQGSRNVIGGPDEDDANLISGNQFGVDLLGHDDVVAGNLIGTDATGRKVVLPAHPEESNGAGIGIRGGAHLIAGNLIAGNIEIVDFAAFNAVIGNRIGVDRDGRPFDCECEVAVYTPFNRVGGSRPGEGNLIRGSVSLHARDTIVLGNSLAGQTAIVIRDPGVHNVVGGRSPDGGNLIAGVRGFALADGARLNVIIGATRRIWQQAAGRRLIRRSSRPARHVRLHGVPRRDGRSAGALRMGT